MKAGKVEKEDYHYQRCGHCCLMLAYEPKTGNRLAQVREKKTRKDYAEFMEELASQYPEAEKIIVIQDNLNTHNQTSFYKHFDAKEAFGLSSKFEFHYTPKKSSWLNMVEIEFSVISKQCLDRRIDEMEKLEKEVLALCKKRNERKTRINWQFTVEKARVKFGRHYKKIHNT